MTVKRMFATAVICTLAATAHAQSAADEAFENLAEEYVSDLVNISPVAATSIGDHSADGELDQVDADARAERAAIYREYLAALDHIDRYSSRHSEAIVSSWPSSRSTSASFAPLRESLSAIAPPSPRAPPVITIVLLLRSINITFCN